MNGTYGIVEAEPGQVVRECEQHALDGKIIVPGIDLLAVVVPGVSAEVADRVEGVRR